MSMLYYVLSATSPQLSLTVLVPNTRRGIQGTCQASPRVVQMLLRDQRARAQTSVLMSRHEDMHTEGA